VIHLGRGFTDYIKPFQEETLAIIYPFAGNSCLNKCEHGFPGQMLHIHTNIYHCCISLRAWTPMSSFPIKLRTSIQNSRQVVKNLSIASCISSTPGPPPGILRRCFVQKQHAYPSASPMWSFWQLERSLTSLRIARSSSSQMFLFCHDFRRFPTFLCLSPKRPHSFTQPMTCFPFPFPHNPYLIF